MTPSLKKLRELALAATPGPWKFYDGKQDGPSDFVYPQQVTAEHSTGCDEEDYTIYQVCAIPNDSYAYSSNFHDNGAFIAAANPAAILKILDALEVARGAINRVLCLPTWQNMAGEKSLLLAEAALEKLKEIE